MAKKISTKDKNAINITLILIIFIVIVGLISIFFSIYKNLPTRDSSTTYEMPLITVPVASKDGSNHTVSVNLSFGGTNKALKNVKNIDARSIVEKAISNMDFSTIAASDGTDKLKQAVLTAIDNNISKNPPDKLYITGIDFDNTKLMGQTNDAKAKVTQKRSKLLKDMFGTGK